MAHIDPYEALGINPGATPDEIKAAYHKRAKETHPDMNREGDAKEFIRVQAAMNGLRA